MQIRTIVTALLLALAATSTSVHAITFSTFVQGSDLAATLGNQATIGFAYAGNKFVGSVYFGANNDQLYSTDLNGANVAKFGSPVPAFSGEVYVSSSLGIGGYGARDVFAGSQNSGAIYRFSNDGSTQSLFASGLVGGVRSIAFDPYGLYGYDMIVATSAGNIYKVSNTGSATLLASVGEDAEGISFAPQAFAGHPAGTLFVASEGSGSLRAIDPGGVITPVISGLYGAEMVSFVPLNLGLSGNPVEGFYAANYNIDVIKAGTSQFTPYIGQAIITGETGHQVWALNTLGQATQIGSFPNQPEDGIFVTADIIHGGVPDHGSPVTVLIGLAFVAFLARQWKP